MTAFILALSLLIGPTFAHAQEQPPELNVPPSPPDASPPQADLPVGVAQPNPDFQAEIERHNEADRREEDARRNDIVAGRSSGMTSVPVRSGVKKLKIAKMVTGPVVAPDAWKKGHWFHGKHDGSFAWWWIVDQNWFHFAKYTYPYPDHEKRQVYLPNSGSTSLSSVAPGQH